MRPRNLFAVFLTLLVAAFIFLSSHRGSAANQDQPSIQKDSVIVTAFTFNVYKGSYDNWSWVPKLQFRTNGPIPSGSQLYAEFNLPTGPWVKFDCSTLMNCSIFARPFGSAGRSAVPGSVSSR